MPIYCEKCRTRIVSGSYCTTCGHMNPQGSLSTEVPSAESSNAASHAFAAPVPGLANKPFQKSLGGSVTLLVFAGLGVLSPFLSYVSVSDESVSGWDSRDIFSAYDEFSASPLLVMLGSLLVLGIAIAVIVKQNQGRTTNKIVAGVMTLVSGIVVVACAGMAYSSWDSILKYEGVLGNQGVGLWLGAVSGIASVVIGIVALSVPRVTQGS